MKLRDKKTGEIYKISHVTPDGEIAVIASDNTLCYIKSLAELNEKCEDYEDPETFWYMTAWGDVKEYSQDQFAIKQKQAIGNYFETKEEAEKAVGKLKAITRLKSCGFKFKGWRTADLGGDKYYFVITAESDGAGKGDLDLLFGGEENSGGEE